MADQESYNKESNNLDYKYIVTFGYFSKENEGEIIFPPENGRIFEGLFEQLEYDNIVTIALEDNNVLEKIDDENDEIKVAIDSETGKTVKIEKSK